MLYEVITCSPEVTNNFVAQSIDYCTGGTITITWTIVITSYSIHYTKLYDGTITITWTIEDLCETQTVTADFSVTPPPALTWTDPLPETHDACEFDAADLTSAQAALDQAIADWVNTNQGNFAAAGGCSPEVTNNFVAQSIDYCTGGTITITWTIEDLCETQTVTADFSVTPPPALTWTDPLTETHDACVITSYSIHYTKLYDS